MMTYDLIFSALKFDEKGLICAIAVDHLSGEVLMQAWMNADAFQKTLETGEAHYWSRSRQSLWHKGATSGATQIVRDIKLDCDGDCLVLAIEQKGSGACHTGRKSCFFRTLSLSDTPLEWKVL